MYYTANHLDSQPNSHLLLNSKKAGTKNQVPTLFTYYLINLSLNPTVLQQPYPLISLLHYLQVYAPTYL